MKYFAEFDSEGNRTAGYVADGMPYTAEDIAEKYPNAIEISDEDQELYITGKYRRGVDGKAFEIPARVYTAEEIKQQEIDVLDATYQSQFADLANAVGLATLASNTALITELQAEYTELVKAYNAERTVIESGS